MGRWKTIKNNAKIVRVPLNGTAMSIIEKCGITRQVTVLNSIKRKEEKVPICTVSSSHMARRTFANIYNKVQDLNLIGSMTGHTEGSRAFARYRTIDESVKKSLVDILG